MFLAAISISGALVLQYQYEKLHYKNIPFGIQLHEEISGNLPLSDRSTIFNSRNSTVKIYSTMAYDYPPFISPIIATGTYVFYGDKFYILTAAHVVNDCESLTFVTSADEIAPCFDIIYLNYDSDIALVELTGPLSDKTPVKLDNTINRSKDYSIGEEIYYTGYPNDSGLLTIKGQIAGYTYDKFLMQSYAWNGASGSGIFNTDGELIGVLSAIQVGYDGVSVELIESIVYGVPIAEIDFTAIK
tara:strand:+ start:38091 stop:38822 length:732 start_codon:yes stop_codon:yes gene_type:complete